MHFYSSWSTPKLQSLFVTNIIPIPFSGCQSLTTLNVLLQHDRYGSGRKDFDWDSKSLSSLLEVFPILEHFKLTLVGTMHGTILTQPHRPVVMTCVTKLDLDFDDCCGAPLRTFFNTVRFPSVTAMQLRISSKNQERKGSDIHFDDIFFAVLSDAETFSKLTEMTLDVAPKEFWDNEADNFIYGKISIPFAMMPKLRYFNLKAHPSKVIPVPDGVALPPIQTLVLRDPPEVRRRWLAKFLKQMKAQGAPNPQYSARLLTTRARH